MSRKNRPSGSSHSDKSLSQKVDHLLRICSALDVPSGSKLWEEHLEIDKTVTEIRSMENGVGAVEVSAREENFVVFMEWLRKHGVNLDKVSIGHFETGSWGVKATQPIKESELWLSVPRNLMMTFDTAQQSEIGDFLVSDKISRILSQVSLALHLLHQRLDPKSFWKPYIDVLPSEYDTVLYFSPQEFQFLKGSHSFEASLNQFRSIARQYAHFWKALRATRATETLRLKNGFTFDNYRWAVSTVMTRQNAIPASDGIQRTSALIPFWDMCNHRTGTLTTDFDLEKDSLECYALQEFDREEQVFIFYGQRSNSEFFLHNAFVVPDNTNDAAKIKLGISKGDALCCKKCHLLERINISGTDTFDVTCASNPISNRLWAFSRIFSMTEGELDNWLKLEDTELVALLDPDLSSVNPDLEKRARNFLLVRLSLLIRAYATNLEEDQRLLKEGNLKNNECLAVNLRITEKKILITATEFLKNSQI